MFLGLRRATPEPEDDVVTRYSMAYIIIGVWLHSFYFFYCTRATPSNFAPTKAEKTSPPWEKAQP